jgi:hypothetical protein
MTRPRQMRRQARRICRSWMQPRMLVTGDDQFPPSVLLLFIHWAWRYRYELGPAVPALATLITAWWLHARDPRWWPLVIGLTAVATSVPLVTGRRLGLPTPTERIYAAAVATTIGGWLAAATVFGPFTAPLHKSWSSEDSSCRCPGGHTAGAAPGSASRARSTPGPTSPRQSD